MSSTDHLTTLAQALAKEYGAEGLHVGHVIIDGGIAGDKWFSRLDHEPDEDRFAELVEILFDQASLAEGGSLQDPSQYVDRLNRLLLELLDQ